MGRKFISVLGAGDPKKNFNYDECIYEFLDEKVKTRYIQKAIIDIFCKDWKGNDKVIFFTTALSKKYHWDREGTLKEELKDYNLIVENKDIPFGGSEGELWELFDIIFNSLEVNDEVIIDITHSFRTIPMFLIIILNYAKVLKNIKVKGIYYGAYANINDEKIAPIYDITMYDIIMDFTNGINTFLNTGNSNLLAEICKDLSSNKYENRTYLDEDVNNTIQSLNDFSKAIMTCRGNASLIKMNDGEKRSIAASYKNFEEEIKNYKLANNYLTKALSPLLEKVANETIDFSDIDPVKNGIATVKWCIKNGLVQQGITALEETIKTLVCVSLKLNCYVENDREIVKNILMVSNKPMYKWRNIKESNIKIVQKFVYSRSIPEDLCELSKNISRVRNDINHFGLSKKALKAQQIGRRLKKHFDEFVEIAERTTWKKYK